MHSSSNEWIHSLLKISNRFKYFSSRVEPANIYESLSNYVYHFIDSSFFIFHTECVCPFPNIFKETWILWMMLCNFKVSINCSSKIIALFPSFRRIVNFLCTCSLSSPSWINCIDLLDHLMKSLLLRNSQSFIVIFNAHPSLNSLLRLLSIDICSLSISNILPFHEEFSLSNVNLINLIWNVLSWDS